MQSLTHLKNRIFYPILFILMLAVSALYLMLSKEGICYLTENQAAYFVYGLRLANPHFILNDWFTWKVFHHHFAFAYLICLLKKLGPLSITTFIADLLLMMGMVYGLFIFCRRFTKYPYLVFLGLISWLGVIGLHETELGKEYLFDGFLQPAELSGCLMILGFALLVERKFLWSGLVLGLAGLFHAAILVSIAPVLCVLLFVMKITKDWRSCLSFFIPLGLCWGFFFVTFTLKAGHVTAPLQETLSILINLRDPYLIATHWSLFWTLNWFVWVLWGLVMMLNQPWNQRFNEWRVCVVMVLFMSLVGILQSVFINVPSITIMMLWRASPLAIILSLVLIINQMIDWALHPNLNTRKDIFLKILAVLFIFYFMSGKWGIGHTRRFMWMMALPLGVIFGNIYQHYTGNQHVRRRIIKLVFVIIMFWVMFRVASDGLKMSRNYEKYPDPPNIGAMERWIKENTPKNAVFVVPLEMPYMRIRAERAIVVDFKPPCYRPCDLQEWYERLCQEAGLPIKPMIHDEDELIKGYNLLDLKRAIRLKQLYGASYVIVLNKEHRGDLTGLKVRFVNEDYKVLEIP